VDNLNSLIELPEGFDGSVRLFPLPNVVLFPHVVQPLHIFEPRYCEMLAEALATDQLIGMATLGEGWEATVTGKPKIAPEICLGKIMSHSPTEDGRHNILLLGIRRGILMEERNTKKPFRLGVVKILTDRYSDETRDANEHLKRELLDRFEKLIFEVPELRQNLRELVEEFLNLGPVTDLIAFTAGIPLCDKLALLREPQVEVRATRLLRLLEDLRQKSDAGEIGPRSMTTEFPPRFSDN
jgi:ATP-dependent Lon protease